MTTPSGPIATEYVEIRPAPGSKEQFTHELGQTVDPAAQAVKGKVSGAIAEGLRSNAGQTGLAVGVGTALGTVIGRGMSAGIEKAYRGATSIIRTGFAEVKDYQAGLAQLDAGIRSTGGSAGVTSKQMEELARSVQNYSGQTDDSIVKSESFLLTFDKIRNSVGAGNDVFDRATKATADLAARFGGDASGKAILLGKALQDPQRGLVGLARAGITFNDSQTTTIRKLDATGHSLEAQKLILAEVEKQVGGSAKAYGQTLPGEIDKAHRAWEDFSQNTITRTYEIITANKTLTEIVVGVGGAVYIAHKALSAFHALQGTLLAGTAKKVGANEAVARSYDAVTTSATRAAEAETAAADAGGVGLGRGGQGRLLQTGSGGLPASRGGVVSTVGGAAVGIVLAGVTVAVDEALNRRGLDRSIKEQVKAAQAAGPQAVKDLARQYGVTPGAAPGQFITDPKQNSDTTNAAVEALARVMAQERAAQAAAASHLAQVGAGVVAAEQRLAGSRSALAAARAARLDPKTLIDTGVIGGAFDVLPNRHPNDPAAAREQLRAAQQQIRDAQDALTAARRGGPGASHGQLAGAEASVLAARDAIHKRGGDSRVEQLRLEAAESRLADLRSKGGASTDKIREAEDKLAAARRDATKAAKDVHDAEKGTALSAAEVLKRITGQASNAIDLRNDAKKLTDKGVSEPVLLAIEGLEKQAPGTMDKLAKTLTSAQAKALDSQQSHLAKATYELYDAARVAGINDAIRAAQADKAGLNAQLAAAQVAGYRKAFAIEGVGLNPFAPPDRGHVPRLIGGEPRGGVRTGAGPQPTDLGGFLGRQTTYDLRGSTIVANNPAELHRQLVHRERMTAT